MCGWGKGGVFSWYDVQSLFDVLSSTCVLLYGVYYLYVLCACMFHLISHRFICSYRNVCVCIADMTDNRRCRLCLVFAADYLHSVHQVELLCPTATSIHLPRSVDCHFASAQLAAAAHHELQQSAVHADGRLLHSAQLVTSEHKLVTSQQRRFKDLCRLYVRGVRSTVCRQGLVAVFSGCCDVTIPAASNGHGKSGHAFVQFERAELAAEFVRKPPTLDGRLLTVSYALERGDRVGRGGDVGDGSRFVPVHVDLSQARQERIHAAQQRQKRSKKSGAKSDKSRSKNIGKPNKKS